MMFIAPFADLPARATESPADQNPIARRIVIRSPIEGRVRRVRKAAQVSGSVDVRNLLERAAACPMDALAHNIQIVPSKPRRKEYSKMNFKKLVLCAAIICALAAIAFAQGNRGKAEVTVKGKKITIDYGRPSLNGQASRLGEAADGMVWRLGMNQATHIETSGDLTVGGTEVKAGKYTLWAKKSGNQWLLSFHPKTGVWGAPPLTDGFIAQTPLKLEKATESLDLVTISLADAKGKVAFKVQWGTDVLTGSFDVK